MLGRHHTAITIATVVPFMIPLLFGNITDWAIPISFVIAVLIGSLTPDADCGGKATLFYKFNIVDSLMKKVIIRPIVFVFERFVSKRYSLEYEVKEEHRGIMHSPVGVVISSLMLTLIVLIIMLVISKLSFYVLLAIFGGLLFGQFMHLIEDSCTISGINWKFPFGTKHLSGKIYTFGKEEGKEDIRPMAYQYALFLITIILIISYLLDIVKLPISVMYLGITSAVLLVWLIILFVSRTEYAFWYQDKMKVKSFKKSIRAIGRQVK